MLIGIREIEPTPIVHTQLPTLFIDGVQIERTVCNTGFHTWSGKLMMQHAVARDAMLENCRLILGSFSSRLTGTAAITDVSVTLPQPEHQPLMACVEFSGASELLIDGKNGFSVEFKDGGRLEFFQKQEDRDDGQ